MAGVPHGRQPRACEISDGRTFENVIVAGDRVVKVLGRDDVPFEASDVVAVNDFSDAPLPPGY